MSLKTKIKAFPLVREAVWGKTLYKFYKNCYPVSLPIFLLKNILKIRIVGKKNDKPSQISKLLRSVNINPSFNNSFFYSLDPYKKIEASQQIFENFTLNYNLVVNGSLEDIRHCLLDKIDQYAFDEIVVLDAIEKYIVRLKRYQIRHPQYQKQVEAISSLQTRPAQNLFEAMQRILFVNQLLWQTLHKNNGLGHLDWILIDLYRKDICEGTITEKQAEKLFMDFFLILHDNYWYKSNVLLGDTGQIIILGGCTVSGDYNHNELTQLFIEISKNMGLPDPKILLRVSTKMPDYLLKLALECIETGIGAPLLSNDDRVIPALLSFGYSKEDAFNYVTSACWEPLILEGACEQNNIKTLDFSRPFIWLLESEEILRCDTLEDIKNNYFKNLKIYTNKMLKELDLKQLEKDPLVSLFSKCCLRSRKDITQGGAVNNNWGLTSVGMSTVVNSLLNIQMYVFDKKQYTLYDFLNIQRRNFANEDQLLHELYSNNNCFGHDNTQVVELVNEIMKFTSHLLKQHKTLLGGKYKFGLSSPSYIDSAKNTPATFDGRKAGTAFGVHISGKNGTAPTELISFASKLDYSDNRINGNVVDIIMTPNFIKENFQKIFIFLKAGIKQGFYQMQINVVDSKTLIKAKRNPDLYPNLIVRVWGFSAYFKDLPTEYQDTLIKRSLESEGAA